MASGIYNRFKANLMNKEIDLEVDTINVALYDVGHAFDVDHTDYTIVNELATAGGYTRGGETLTTPAVTEASPTKWDADDVEWTAATFEAFFAVIYDTTAGDELIATIDFGGGKEVTDGTFTIQWDAAGIITLA